MLSQAIGRSPAQTIAQAMQMLLSDQSLGRPLRHMRHKSCQSIEDRQVGLVSQTVAPTSPALMQSRDSESRRSELSGITSLPSSLVPPRAAFVHPVPCDALEEDAESAYAVPNAAPAASVAASTVSAAVMLPVPMSRAQGRRWRRHHASQLAKASIPEVVPPPLPVDPPVGHSVAKAIHTVGGWQPPLPPEPASQSEPRQPPLPVKEAPPSSGLSPHTVRWVCPPLPPLPQLSPALSATRTDAIDEQQLPPGSPTSTELHSWKPPLPPLPEARLEGCYRCAAGRSVHVLSTRA